MLVEKQSDFRLLSWDYVSCPIQENLAGSFNDCRSLRTDCVSRGRPIKSI